MDVLDKNPVMHFILHAPVLDSIITAILPSTPPTLIPLKTCPEVPEPDGVIGPACGRAGLAHEGHPAPHAPYSLLPV